MPRDRQIIHKTTVEYARESIYTCEIFEAGIYLFKN